MGLFISIEGTDGAGKSTQIEMLKAYLDKKDIATKFTREPGATPEGKKIRELLLNKESKIPTTAETLLFFADRVIHTENFIKPELAKGNLVISDRYFDSTRAYQVAGGSNCSEVNQIRKVSLGDFQPDVTIILSISPKESSRRLNKRAEAMDRMELKRDGFRDRLYQEFNKIAKEEPGRVKIIDASGSKNCVFTEVLKVLKPFLQKHTSSNQK